jgi:anti-anti-sigma regulatory factor
MSAEALAVLPVPSRCTFDVTISSPGGATITIGGGLDEPSSLLLEDIVGWLCRDRHLQIAVDATSLGAVHCSALAALTRAAAAAHESGGTLSVTGSTAMARRLIELAELVPGSHVRRQADEPSPDGLIPTPRRPLAAVPDNRGWQSAHLG